MAKLPTYRDLGGLPSARSGRVIANYDTSAAGRGLASLGEAIAGAAGTIGNLAGGSGGGGIGGVSQAEKFEANRRYLEFVSSQQQTYEDSKSSVDPGAFGFREQAQNNYLNAAKEFFATVPDALKPEYDMKLFAVEDDFLTKSRAFETAERTRYYGEEVNKGLGTLESNLFSNPENFDKNFSEGAAYINSIPDEHRSRHGICVHIRGPALPIILIAKSHRGRHRQNHSRTVLFQPRVPVSLSPRPIQRLFALPRTLSRCAAPNPHQCPRRQAA